MSTLDFIPHSLKRKRVGLQNPTGPSSSKPPIIQTASKSAEATPRVGPPSQNSKKEKQAILPSWDFAFLVWLALSDYWLWADGDLRRRIETSDGESDPVDNLAVGEKESQDKTDEQGYVPIDHLLKKSHVFNLVSNLKPYCNAKELIYVNSLRQFANGAIDVRFIVDPESSSTRSAVSGRRKRKPQSGYEVRRSDFASLKDSEFSRYSKSRWDALTVYMENIPIQYANVPGIGKLLEAFLPASSDSPIGMKRVQNIVFPPHHQDTPGSIPTCKGFALITLSSEDDVQTLLDAWPWDSKKHTDLKQDDMTVEKANNQSTEERSAKASGLRICTKARWEELRAEYLLHRQQLVDEVNQYQDEEESRRQEGPLEEDDKVASSSKRTQLPESTAQSQNEAGIHPDSPYPTACLVFIRHVHPETNKTTLRTLFSQACAESDNAIDYIDYSKNTDSCYVRFGTPAHAEVFVDYFSCHHISQSSGLDSRGSESSDVGGIVAEIVLGKREEVYWDKIPEKLRRQAVEKTLRALSGHGHQGSSGAVDTPQEGDGGGRRKRRRKAKASE